MAEVGKSNGLGFGHGSLIEYPDGTVEYRRTMELMPAFRVRVRDVVGFSVRRVTRDDKKRLQATGVQQILTLQGSGTTLAEVAVNYGTAEKIEDWFRAHADFGQGSQQAGHDLPHKLPSSSVADELLKLAQLREAGVLTPEEFETQKKRLLN